MHSVCIAYIQFSAPLDQEVASTSRDDALSDPPLASTAVSGVKIGAGGVLSKLALLSSDTDVLRHMRKMVKAVIDICAPHVVMNNPLGPNCAIAAPATSGPTIEPHP